MAVDYKSTCLLPKTDFPMKADLPKREPGILARWEKERIFHKVLDARKGAPTFSLHDGPPYANGHIHQGHTLNKILKDLVVKFRTMTGHRVDYIPGWDCHGLPIETALEKQMGAEEKARMSKVDFRQRCREYAMEYVGIQREEFKRLGVFGRWDDPYLTMAPGYEAIIAREFGKFVGNGGAYKGKRPVHWCWNDRTALAEAEVEFEQRDDPSIYVKFPLPEASGVSFKGKKTFIVIWTTTPWTLPANLGISLNPELEYVAVEPSSHPGEAWVVAKGLLARFLEETGTPAESMLLGDVDPKKLDGKDARHPFMDRASKIMLGEHVTLEAGTGCVHTAPGHGADDFAIGRKYGLEVLVPVNDAGVLTDEAGPFAGEFIFKANPKVIERLRADGLLVQATTAKHDYPHCWRCKKPVIFRATTQWFISMEKNDLRKKALAAIEDTTWIPGWGKERIHGMIANRPDWCVSRQRTWGVPIIAFRCDGCSETHTTQAIVDRVSQRFESEGADAWYARPAAELIGDEKCPKCGKKEWTKEDDILDVWFESGVSFAAVCEPRPDLGFPVDLYLEGSDQHRGWFHSTLLAATGTRGRNAYRSCLTHGFVVGPDGKKLSKSAKNYVAFDTVIAQSGAELLRLWVAGSEFREDIRLSTEIMKGVGEAYFTIRNNLAKNALGNLFDFDPARNRVAVKDMPELDRLMLHRLAKLVDQIRAAYEAYEFHVIYHAVVNFAAVDLSALYTDALKERLYNDRADSPARRAAQTVLFEILQTLTRALAPVLAFTTEEIWGHLPRWDGKEDSVHLARFPEPPADWRDDALAAEWEKLLAVRTVVLKKLEEMRASQDALYKERKALREKKDGAPESAKRLEELDRLLVGKASDARATIAVPRTGDGPTLGLLEGKKAALREALGVSDLVLAADDAVAKEPGSVKVTVEHAPGSQCARCWLWFTALEGEVCRRCKEAMAAA